MDAKGFTLVELLAVIVVLGIISLLGMAGYNTIATAIKENEKDNLIKKIETKASKYAFDTGKTIIFVDELISEGYIDSDEESGDIIDPLTNERMNCYIIEMEKVSNYYEATLKSENNYDNDGVCDLNKLQINSNDLSIEVTNGEKINNWYKGSITLKALSNTLNIDCINARCVWNSSGGASKIGVDTITINDVRGILKTLYTFQYTTNTNDGNIHRYTESINLNIDNEAPIIYKNEIVISDRYVNASKKTVNIPASDGSGSGIDGYYLSLLDVNCNNISLTYQKENTFTVTENGNYTICVKDKVGNTTKSNITVNYIS